MHTSVILQLRVAMAVPKNGEQLIAELVLHCCDQCPQAYERQELG
jgi:hypothetical protein